MKSLRSHVAGRGFIGLTLLGLLIVIAIMLFLYYGHGPGSKGYVKTVVESKKVAARAVSQVELRDMFQSLQTYAITNEGAFPRSVEELIETTQMPQEWFAASADQEGLVYLPGQNERMPATNVLIYENNSNAPTGCLVLRLSGQVDRLPPQAVLQEVQQTRRSIR